MTGQGLSERAGDTPLSAAQERAQKTEGVKGRSEKGWDSEVTRRTPGPESAKD